MSKSKVNTSNYVGIIENVKNYFKNFQFESTFNLVDGVALKLHWADSTSLVNNVRKKAKLGEDQFFSQRNFAISTIESLKKVPVWLNNGGFVFAMSMYDLYHTMGQFIKKESLETELYNIQQVSFIGPLGPFKEMPLIDCINEQTLNIYIHWLVMTNKLPQRAFRLLTEGVVYAELHQGEQMAETTFKVSQITDSGILFKSNNDLLLEKLAYTDNVKIYFDNEKIHEAVNAGNTKENADLFYTQDKLKYFKIDSDKVRQNLKYNSHKSGEFYLFCRYHHMKESDTPVEMKKFTTDLKELLLDSVA